MKTCMVQHDSDSHYTDRFSNKISNFGPYLARHSETGLQCIDEVQPYYVYQSEVVHEFTDDFRYLDICKRSPDLSIQLMKMTLA